MTLAVTQGRDWGPGERDGPMVTEWAGWERFQV